MKKNISLLIFIVGCIVINAQDPHYEITGNITGAEGVIFTLQKTVQGKTVNMNAAEVNNGTFKMIGGSVTYPQRVRLTVMDKKKSMFLFLENSPITITGTLEDLESAKVTGSKTQDELYNLEDLLSALLKEEKSKIEELQAAAKMGFKNKAENLNSEVVVITKKIREIKLQFLKDNPKTFIAPIVIQSMLNSVPASELDELVNRMDPSVSAVPQMTEIRSKLDVLKRVEPGQKAPDFTMEDVSGKPVSLSSVIGSRLLLIDFWAGWCGPCRAENPNIVKVYKDYHSKGFDILGVSLDRNIDEWKKAIDYDGLKWTQVSDLQFWNNKAAKLYCVSSIPANFLLDEKGVIIARNLRGEALRNKVAEILGEK
jgi:peroxiredoxin